MLDAYGRAPLHIASLYARVQIAKLLVASGADVHVSAESGSTPLHYAAMAGCLALTLWLLEMGAKVDDLTVNYKFPLHLACICTR